MHASVADRPARGQAAGNCVVDVKGSDGYESRSMRRVTTLILVLLWASSAPAAESAADEAKGSLYLKTEPAGAEVFFDGERLAKRSPVTVEDVPEGEHRFRLVHGELEVKFTLAVHADKFREVLIDLRNPTGKLKLVTDPLEAEVRLDGESVGQTPVILPAVPFGVHRVKIAKPGYRALEIEIAIRSPDQARVAVHLDELGSGPTAAPAGEGEDGAGETGTAEQGAAVPDGEEPAAEPAGGGSVARVFQWCLLGAGVGLLGGGIAFEVHAAQAADAAESEYDAYLAAADRGDPGAGHYDNAEHNRKIARNNETAAAVLFGVGGAAVVGGLLWMLLAPDSQSAPSAALLPGGGAAVVIRGQW